MYVGIKISGGILSHILNEIEIICLPKDIPENIDVDVTNLEFKSEYSSNRKSPCQMELSYSMAEIKKHDTAVVKYYKPVEEVIEGQLKIVVDDEGTTEDSKEAKANESDSSDDKPENKQDNKNNLPIRECIKRMINRPIETISRTG